MSRVSGADWKRHEEALEMMEGDEPLKPEQIYFVLNRWNPNTVGNVSKNAAFFTPMEAAKSLLLMTTNADGRMLDLGAGIGVLTYWIKAFSHWQGWNLDGEIVALEINPDYVAVGKRLFPDVTWVCGDMFDRDTIASLGEFDIVVSNPPFGRVPTTSGKGEWLAYNGEASLMAVEVAMRICKRAAGFIMPSTHLPFEYSGKQHHSYKPERSWSTDYKKFHEILPDVHLDCVGYDMEVHRKEWVGAAPNVEIVSVDTDFMLGELTLDTKVVKGQPSII